MSHLTHFYRSTYRTVSCKIKLYIPIYIINIINKEVEVKRGYYPSTHQPFDDDHKIEIEEGEIDIKLRESVARMVFKEVS